MPVIAEVLSDAARTAWRSVRDFSRHSKVDYSVLASRIRWAAEGCGAVDRQSSDALRSYQLRNSRGLPVGVALRNAREASFFKGTRDPKVYKPLIYKAIETGDFTTLHRKNKMCFGGTRVFDTTEIGIFELVLPKGVDSSENYRKWKNHEPHLTPQAKWIESPFEDAAKQGNRPVRIVVHHDGHGFATEIMLKRREVVSGRTLEDDLYEQRYVDAEELAARLLQNDYLKKALKEHPNSDIWLHACTVGEHEVEVIAKALERNIYYPTGDIIFFDARWLVNAKSADSLPYSFSVTDDVLRDFNASLSAASHDVGNKYGWSALAVYGDANSGVHPIQKVTP